MSALVKFKAGRVDFNEDTKVCTPQPIKGEITIRQSEEAESFFDFIWSPRENTAGNVQSDELLVIPGDVTWKHVKSCNTGRVFKLKFLSSGAQNLFWLQDPPDDEDEPGKLTLKDIELASKIEQLFKEIDDDE